MEGSSCVLLGRRLTVGQSFRLLLSLGKRNPLSLYHSPHSCSASCLKSTSSCLLTQCLLGRHLPGAGSVLGFRPSGRGRFLLEDFARLLCCVLGSPLSFLQGEPMLRRVWSAFLSTLASLSSGWCSDLSWALCCAVLCCAWRLLSLCCFFGGQATLCFFPRGQKTLVLGIL